MACFATPYGLRYTAHCFNRAYTQNNRQALIPAGGKLGVTTARLEIAALNRGLQPKEITLVFLLSNSICHAIQAAFAAKLDRPWPASLNPSWTATQLIASTALLQNQAVRRLSQPEESPVCLQ